MGSSTARIIGTLQLLDSSQEIKFVYVRIDDVLLHLPVANRGVLEGEKIRKCNNPKERHEQILPDTPVALDVTLDSNGKRVLPIAWAHKPTKRSTKRQKSI
jgi:hypothetical protein